jgi:hypothetical protein
MTGPSAGTSRVTELRGLRYGEIFLITSQAGQVTAAVYNTTGLNDCPPAAWRSLDPHELAKDFGIPAVHLNGPRFWTLDQIGFMDKQCPIEACGFSAIQAVRAEASRP